MKVSVVIPVYNTPRNKFTRLLNSVLAQTEQSFEIIVIDDGSNAETAEALDAIAQGDSRISVYHQQNQGGGGFPARYDGIAKAKGDYVYIPDSDDILHPQLLEYCLWAAETKGAEFVAFRFEKIKNGLPQEVPNVSAFESTPLYVIDPEAPLGTVREAISLIHVDNWAQFARRELMQGLPKRKVSDLARTFRLIKGAKRWAATPLQLYFYDTSVIDSITHGKYSLEQVEYLHKDLKECYELFAEERHNAFNPIWEMVFRNFIVGSLKITYNAIHKRKLNTKKSIYLFAFSDLLNDLFRKNRTDFRRIKFKYRWRFLCLLLWRKIRGG